MHESLAKFLFGVRDHNVTLLCRVLHDVMRADHAIKKPAVAIEFFDEVFAAHGVYDTHDCTKGQRLLR